MLNWLGTFLLNPALAIGGAAVASPILIHLFSRRRFRRIRWAAMDFLLEAHRKNRRRIRLEQWLLLALRCLAVLLLAAVIARPFLRPGALAALAPAGRTEHLFLLDDSYSMTYRSPSGAGGGQTVFSRAVEAVLGRLRAVASENEADSATVLLTSRPQQPLATAPSLSSDNLQRLTDALGALPATQQTAQIDKALSAVADLLRSAPRQVNQTVYVVSDFQRVDWITAKGASTGESGAVFEPLRRLVEDGWSLRLVLLDVAVDDEPRNVAVVGLKPDRTRIVAGIPARFEAEIANHSPKPLEQLELSVATAAGTLPPVIVPSLPPGATVHQRLEALFQQAGSDFLQLQMAAGAQDADGIALDNERGVAVSVSPAVRVLAVNGEPGVDPYDDEVYLLRTALRPAGRAASGNEVAVIVEQDLEGADLSGEDVVILANVSRLTPGALRNLETAVRGGAGLIIFAGDLIDIDFYDDLLYNDGQGPLPGPIADFRVAAGGGDEAFSLAEWEAGHPILRSFVDQLATVLRQVRVTEFVELRSTDPPLRVLAWYNDPRHSPAIVERSFGRGTVLFFTTTADQEWNDWASNFSFLPLMMEAVQYAARRSDAAPQACVGAPLDCPADDGAFVATARLRPPGYPSEPETTLKMRSLTAVAPEETPRPGGGEPAEGGRATSGDGGGRRGFRYLDTTRSGIYEFHLTDNQGGQRVRHAAVNLDPTESDVARAGESALRAALGDLKFEYVRDVGRAAQFAAGSRVEIWWPLLLAAAFVLMTEHALAWWFGTRG